MKCLFLPNFRVYNIPEDNITVPSPNKLVKDSPYWFFRHMPGWSVDVLDNSGLLPASLTPLKDKIGVLQALKALLRVNEYDFILAHSYNSAFALSFIRAVLGLRTPPLFVIDVGCLNGHRDNPIEIRIIERALESVDGIIYHSRINEEFYSKHFQSLRREFVHFGTDLEFFRPLPRQPSLAFALSIGKRNRDYETLIKAWVDIDFPLRVVGPTSITTPAPSDVTVTKQVSILELRELIHDARIVVLPIADKRYSIGQMTLTQCMAMGKAIIVTDVPGIADYIQPGYNCIAVKPGDEGRIADSVRQLVNDDELRKRLSVNAQKTAQDQFGEQMMALRISQFVNASIRRG